MHADNCTVYRLRPRTYEACAQVAVLWDRPVLPYAYAQYQPSPATAVHSYDRVHACLQANSYQYPDFPKILAGEKSSAICTAHFAHPPRMSVCLTVVFCAHAVRPSHPAAHSDQPQTSACSPDRQTRKKLRWMSPAGPSAALVLLKNRVHGSEHFSN